MQIVESVDFVKPGWYGIIQVDNHKEGIFICSFDEAANEDIDGLARDMGVDETFPMSHGMEPERKAI